MRKVLVILFSAAMAVVTTGPAKAQDWPSKPIVVNASGGAGGASDVLIRTIGEPIVKRLGQQIVMNPMPGAGGQLAAKSTASAPPDGYTYFLNHTQTHAFGPSLYKQLTYDPIKDFTPIARLAVMPNVLYVNKDFPVSSVKELIAYAKVHPGEVNFASSGVGSSTQISSVLFAQMAGIDIVHVPFAGGSAAVQGVLSGEAQMSFENLAAVLGQVKAGAVKALAVSGTTRAPQLPDLPTVAEAGLPGFDVSPWFGIIGPAGLPKPISDKFQDEIRRSISDEAVIKRLSDLGAIPAYQSGKEFGEYMQGEIARWKPVIHKAGIQEN